MMKNQRMHARMSRIQTCAGAVLITMGAGTGIAQPTVTELIDADNAEGDVFGCAVAIEGNVAVVGARDDEEGPYSWPVGSVSVFCHDGSTWGHHQKLVASDAHIGALFGYAVAIQGDLIVVGSPYAGQAPAPATSGAAYVFRYNPIADQWQEEQILTASDPATNARFGRSVALDGDKILVGADGYASGRGVAYVYHYNSGSSQWDFKAKLLAYDGEVGDELGYAVAIIGDYALVGAFGDASDQGSVYIFKYGGVVWSHWNKLTASDGAAGDRFGCALSLDGDLLAVGAEMDDFDNDGYAEGSAYVFRYIPASQMWAQEHKLTGTSVGAHPPPERYYHFGATVGASGNRIIVGAPQEWAILRDSGAAYVFRGTFNGSTWDWTETDRLLAPDQGVDDMFGSAVALWGGSAAIGTPYDDDACGPVPTIPGCNNGAAHVFEVGCLFSFGDLNEDDRVDTDDIECFLDCLLDPASSGCECYCADMNHDRSIDGRDIQLFTMRILAGLPG